MRKAWCITANGTIRRETPSRRVQRAWKRAGWRAGLCLGAIGGAVLIAPEGTPAVAVVGAIAGAVVGAFSGWLVGWANGAMAVRFVGPTTLGPPATYRPLRPAVVAVVTTAVTGLATQLVLFGWVPELEARLLLVYLPVALAVVIAGAISTRLSK